MWGRNIPEWINLAIVVGCLIVVLVGILWLRGVYA